MRKVVNWLFNADMPVTWTERVFYWLLALAVVAGLVAGT